MLRRTLMAGKDKTTDSRGRLAKLAQQGRAWKFVERVSKFERPPVFLDPPLEITEAMVRGLRMVDETVVVHGRSPKADARRDDRNAGGEP
jgi:hypothetical protein